MGATFEAKNVKDAVGLALEFKLENRYDWFRGQTQNWPLKSSLVRLDTKGYEEALNKLGRFENWVKSTAGLESIASSADYILAVGQHYGIPTNFIDFTTEPNVAGFFASESPPSDLNRPSCIMCLDTKDLAHFERYFMANGYPPPEFLELDVPNLWRLEAQSGVFLFCPFTHFERIYDLDRIVFPYTGPISSPNHDEIYPKRKSSLEILLDQYFLKELLREGERFFREEVSRHNVEIIRSDFGPKKWDQELITNEPSILESWSSPLLQVWIDSNQEKLLDAKSGFGLKVELDSTKSSLHNGDNIYRQIRNQLDSQDRVKEKLLEWHVTSTPNGQIDNSFVENALNRLWDGLRILPYEIKDICAGLTNCIVMGLVFQSMEKSDYDDNWLTCASLCLGNSIEVEFGVNDGSYARGYVAKKSLLLAVRKDFLTFVNPKFERDIAGNIEGILQAIPSPERLFDFNRLGKVFAHELAATQVLIGRSAIFFSPARLTSFGLP